MTIGIAAFGPKAGAGIIAGLGAVEKIGRGAIGGFVSLVVLTDDERLLRASVQVGGSEALFPEELPPEIAQAQCAGLISSGPNRPEPLSQFITAKIGVGIVTGHRMPHTEGKDKIALNSMVLAEMEAGKDPQTAIDYVLNLYPNADAGFLAVSVNGRPEQWITIKSGITVKSGTTAQVHVDSSRMVKNIVIQNNIFLNDSCAVGLGDIVEVLSHGVRLGWLGYEPFMTLLNGQVVEIDGYKEIKLPVLSQHPYL